MHSHLQRLVLGATSCLCCAVRGRAVAAGEPVKFCIRVRAVFAALVEVWTSGQSPWCICNSKVLSRKVLGDLSHFGDLCPLFLIQYSHRSVTACFLRVKYTDRVTKLRHPVNF